LVGTNICTACTAGSADCTAPNCERCTSTGLETSCMDNSCSVCNTGYAVNAEACKTCSGTSCEAGSSCSECETTD